jgi:hypothetical protein
MSQDEISMNFGLDEEAWDTFGENNVLFNGEERYEALYDGEGSWIVGKIVAYDSDGINCRDLDEVKFEKPELLEKISGKKPMFWYGTIYN